MEIIMDNKNGNINRRPYFTPDPSSMRKAPGYIEAVPGVNTPNIEIDPVDPDEINTTVTELPDYNPPVPNRAWTEMKKKYEGSDIPHTEI